MKKYKVENPLKVLADIMIFIGMLYVSITSDDGSFSFLNIIKIVLFLGLIFFSGHSLLKDFRFVEVNE